MAKNVWAACAIALVAIVAPAAVHGGARTSGAPLGKLHNAFAAGRYEQVVALAGKLNLRTVRNQDYARYMQAQSAYLTGRYRVALNHFRTLARQRQSRFFHLARWRAADCQWRLGHHRQARRAYQLLLGRHKTSPSDIDSAVAEYRIAKSHLLAKDQEVAARQLREFLRRHPEHPLARTAAHELGLLGSASLTAQDRLVRAERLSAAHHWHEAFAELRKIGDEEPVEVRRHRDFLLGMTLFRMRRRYRHAADLLLAVYPHMGRRSAEALFHGARALSRADEDLPAIRWYERLVALYPESQWAAEAQFLAGWLYFNLGHYRDALPLLARTAQRYRRSRWSDDASWFLAFAHYLLGECNEALPLLRELAKRSDSLAGGQGAYWFARCLDALGHGDEATKTYRSLVGRFPFSWYALLARTRLEKQGGSISVFGDAPETGDVTPIAEGPDVAVASSPLIERVDELLAAGLRSSASYELRRGERALLRRFTRGEALATAIDRYHRAGNYHRPWMLAVIYGREALSKTPVGTASIWWQHAYPLAYRDLVDKWSQLGANPRYYLYALMRKESGFDPHTLSYANAQGLLQMIPSTTRQVARELGMVYTEDFLYDPENNLKTASWYVGRLHEKFRKQIPIAAGSFNSGPRPVMRWLEKHGDRPIDEFVELVSYQQTRNYMRRVTETYARYLYLYEDTVYSQPLSLEPNYIKNALTY